MNWIQPDRYYIRTEDDRYAVSKSYGERTTYTAWGPKGSQDVSWLVAHLAICMREINHPVDRLEASFQSDGRALLDVFGTAEEAKQACQEHAAGK